MVLANAHMASAGEMTPDLARLLELSGGVNVTIAAATKKNGNIDRKKADRMIDPHGYFAKNKRKNRLREYLATVEADRQIGPSTPLN
jgi:hypothetical protein